MVLKMGSILAGVERVYSASSIDSVRTLSHFPVLYAFLFLVVESEVVEVGGSRKPLGDEPDAGAHPATGRRLVRCR